MMLLSFPPNKNYCDEPNAGSEFIFASDPLPIYYSFEGNTLNLFLTSTVAQPSDFQSEVRVFSAPLIPPPNLQMFSRPSKRTALSF